MNLPMTDLGTNAQCTPVAQFGRYRRVSRSDAGISEPLLMNFDLSVRGPARPRLLQLEASSATGFAAGTSWSSVFSSRRMILPDDVVGSAGTNCTSRGTL